MRGVKFSNKKARVLVEGENSDTDSSFEGNSDHLSYSYSCVKSFHKNQHIIGDLAALHKQRGNQGITHQPALYSLSGERNRPICQPFYCSNVSANSNTSEEEYDLHQNNVGVEQEELLTRRESHQHFPVKAMLLQWLKYQFKQVNSLWSFTIPKDFFIPKLCKRNQKMKMEMTLNSVDEETKHRLINYINKFNLGFEEHCNLCTGNETVLEIDVTSILDDPNRLQSFLTYLKSIESEKPNVSNRNVTPDLYEQVDNTHPKEWNITKKKYQKKERPDHPIKFCRKSAVKGKNTYQTYSSSATSSESDERFQAKPKQDKRDTNYQSGEGRIQIVHSKSEKVHRKKDTNHQICNEDEIIQHKGEQIESKVVLQGKRRSRQLSTLSPTNDVQHVSDQRKLTTKQVNKSAEPRKVHFEQSVFDVQTDLYTANNKTSQYLNKVNREFSCKCLMHYNREDYYRYKHLCLFGKGDEMNNSFIKYVNQREKKSELSLYSDENQHNLPNEIDNVTKVETLKLSLGQPEKYERLVSRTNLQVDSNNNFTDSVKSKSLDVKTDCNSQKRVPTKENSNPKDQSICSSKEAFCLKEFSSLTTDDENLDRDLKAIARNACYESLSHCFDSFSNITSGESSVRKNTQGSNQASFSNKYDSCKLGHEGSTNEGLLKTSFDSTDRDCNNGDKRVRTQTTSRDTCNYSDFGPGHRLHVKVPDSNDNMLMDGSYLDNVEDKAKFTIRNGTKSRECNLNENQVIGRGDVGDSNNLHGLTCNTCVSNEPKIFIGSHSDTPSGNQNKIYPQTNENECCVLGCECEKSEKRKSKIKTIVFRIGSSNNELKISTIPPSKKRNTKLKSYKAKEVCKKISSVFKGKESVQNEEIPVMVWNGDKTDKTINYSSAGVKSFSNKSGTNSNSWVDCGDYSSFIDSLTSRSKGTTNTCTPTSVDLESSSLISDNLGMVLSELKSQRMEIEYMKKLLSNQIT